MNITEQLHAQILRKTCVRFRLVSGGTLILYLGNCQFDDTAHELTFWIDCAWRLRRGSLVEVGSLDEADMVLRQLRQIEGLAIKGVSVDNDTGDLCVYLDDGLSIETFGYAVIDELWELRRKDGFRLGVGPQFQPFTRYENPDQN